MPAGAPPRVLITEVAARLLHELRDRHGPLLFHQSGGCCDGSSPMCYPDGEFIVGDRAVHLFFSAPREAPTTRGFASIMSTGLDGQPAADVVQVQVAPGAASR